MAKVLKVGLGALVVCILAAAILVWRGPHAAYALGQLNSDICKPNHAGHVQWIERLIGDNGSYVTGKLDEEIKLRTLLSELGKSVTEECATRRQ